MRDLPGLKASKRLTTGAIAAVFGFLAIGFAHAGMITSQAFTGDADSGVSAASVYTHAVDVNGAGTTVNGVTFVAGGASGSDVIHRGSWSFSIPGQNSFTNYPNTLTGNINQVARDFLFSTNAGTVTQTLTLTGLTPGTTYKLVIYNVGFGSPGTRVQNISDSQGGSLAGYDQNAFGNGNGSLLMDSYTATATSFTMTFVNTVSNRTFHQYAFSNEVVPEPSSTLLALGGGLLAALTRRRRA